MNIKRYKVAPESVISRLIDFDSLSSPKPWGELTAYLTELNKKYPNVRINSAPLVYVDIENETSGLIFIDDTSDELYYVFS